MIQLKKFLKKEIRGTKKAWIFDVAVLGFVLVIATVIMVLLAYTWTQFQPQLDAMNQNAAIPLNQSTINQIDSIGIGYFLTGGPSFIILLFGVMVAALFISAWAENAGFISFPIGIIFLIAAIFLSFMLSDFAHAILTSPTLGSLTAQYYSGPLYLLDNLPIITGILGIGYLVFILLHRNNNPYGTGGASAGRIVSG